MQLILREMTPRAIYRASIRLGDWTLPIKLYAAVEDRKVHFRLLHAADGAPVKQRMIDPTTNEPVPRRELLQGYRTASGEYVLVTDDEQDKLEPEPSREIEVVRFVPPRQVGHQWYVRPYYLGPDGDAGAYFAFTEALAKEDREGIVRWVMRKKEYRGSLRAEDGYLLLTTLRHAEEVIDADRLPVPTGRDLDKKELEMAEQLVGMLSGDFDPTAFQDEYRERLLDLLEKKARGGAIQLRAPKPKPKKAKSLADTLAASIRQERERRVA